MALGSNALIFLLGEAFDEALLLQSRLVQAGVQNPIFALRDFSESKRHLLHLATEREWSEVSESHLAIVSMSQAGGAIDFIQWVRSEPSLSRMHVLLLMNPASPAELRRAMDCGASGFHSHRADFEKLAAHIRELTSPIRTREKSKPLGVA